MASDSYFYEWTKENCESVYHRIYEADPRATDGSDLFPACGPILPKTLLTEEHMHGDKKVDDKVLKCLKSLQYQKYKVVNDPIHGTIELHPLLAKIIETTAFDRLKYVKQLGGVYYVYPGVTHTRFEHSIGTCYIAGEFIRMLKTKQPELFITDMDVLCVEIAGLCHDLGHGPFSHMFEYGVCKKIIVGRKWNHEDMSKAVFKHIWKELDEVFKMYGFTDKELNFVLELIHPANDEESKKKRKKRSFLYEIVANEENGIDVDKWDYFARDCHHLGIACDFDWRRLMALSRVIFVQEGDTQVPHICYRDKEMKNIYGMFRTRSNLHQRAYQHKTKTAIEMMFSEAIVQASDEPLFNGTMSIKQIVESAETDIESYLLLTDAIIQQIQSSSSSKKPKQLIERISQRKIYRLVWTQLYSCAQQSFEEVELQKNLRKMLKQSSSTLQEATDNVYVKVIQISHGSKKGNTDPVEDVYFYKKDEPWKEVAKKDLSVSELLLPKVFTEVEVRVYLDVHNMERSETYDYRDEIKQAIVKLTSCSPVS